MFYLLKSSTRCDVVLDETDEEKEVFCGLCFYFLNLHFSPLLLALQAVRRSHVMISLKIHSPFVLSSFHVYNWVVDKTQNSIFSDHNQ